MIDRRVNHSVSSPAEMGVFPLDRVGAAACSAGYDLSTPDVVPVPVSVCARKAPTTTGAPRPAMLDSRMKRRS